MHRLASTECAQLLQRWQVSRGAALSSRARKNNDRWYQSMIAFACLCDRVLFLARMQQTRPRCSLSCTFVARALATPRHSSLRSTNICAIGATHLPSQAQQQQHQSVGVADLALTGIACLPSSALSLGGQPASCSTHSKVCIGGHSCSSRSRVRRSARAARVATKKPPQLQASAATSVCARANAKLSPLSV